MSVPLVVVGTTLLVTSLDNLALLVNLAPLEVAVVLVNLAEAVAAVNLELLVVAVVVALLAVLAVLHRVVLVNLALLVNLGDRVLLALLVVEVPAVNLDNLERLVTLERLDNLDNLEVQSIMLSNARAGSRPEPKRKTSQRQDRTRPKAPRGGSAKASHAVPTRPGKLQARQQPTCRRGLNISPTCGHILHRTRTQLEPLC